MSERINFEAKNDFILKEPQVYANWIEKVIVFHQKSLGEINYIFCSDDQLLPINKEYLDHDTLTDIITFDDSQADLLIATIFISTERVKENADLFAVPFEDELKRVMIHGVLHCIGFTDATEEQKQLMRKEEEEMMKLFHVEH